MTIVYCAHKVKKPEFDGEEAMENKMFCYQCQETAGCTGCTRSGVCGKKPDLALSLIHI